jgi:hypothetical protein
MIVIIFRYILSGGLGPSHRVRQLTSVCPCLVRRKLRRSAESAQVNGDYCKLVLKVITNIQHLIRSYRHFHFLELSKVSSRSMLLAD